MNLVKNKPERIETKEGFIYNAFPRLELGRGYHVLIPSLALGEEDARKPKKLLFTHPVEHASRSRKVRIIANCIGEIETGQTCNINLVDSNGEPTTDFFKPKAGIDLRETGNLPGIMAHTFGIIGLGSVVNLIVEAANNTDAGIVRKS